ncbi:MAG: class I SAM-dependent methyltransferase [bacterium]
MSLRTKVRTQSPPGFFRPLIQPAEFESWHDYYSRYQYLLAKDYICPTLEKWGVRIAESHILDVGCGDGGFAHALVNLGAECLGLDIKNFNWATHATPGLRFITGDICNAETVKQIGGKFDLIIARDVIEHISDKEAFFRNVLSLLKDDGRLFFTFPPFYSPFGAHQQVFLKSKLKALPYLHWLPDKPYTWLVSHFENGTAHWAEILDIRKTRTSIRLFKSLVKRFGLRILKSKYYLFRPTFRIRYGLPPLGAFWGKVPWLNEITVTAVYFLLARSSSNG